MKTVEERRTADKLAYWKHHNECLLQKRENRHKLIKSIVKALGEKCAICNTTEKLVVHHMEYETKNPFPSLKALNKGNLVLVCRKHHRAIHYIRELKCHNELEKVLKLLNRNDCPIVKISKTRKR